MILLLATLIEMRVYGLLIVLSIFLVSPAITHQVDGCPDEARAAFQRCNSTCFARPGECHLCLGKYWAYCTYGNFCILDVGCVMEDYPCYSKGRIQVGPIRVEPHMNYRYYNISTTLMAQNIYTNKTYTYYVPCITHMRYLWYWNTPYHAEDYRSCHVRIPNSQGCERDLHYCMCRVYPNWEYEYQFFEVGMWHFIFISVTFAVFMEFCFWPLL